MGLIRIIMFAAVAFLVYSLFKRIVGGVRPAGRQERQQRRTRHLEGQLVQDPQCHIYVDSNDAVQRQVPNGTLFFCSEACAKAYMKEDKEKQTSR